jgi:hypothetical protein
VSTPSAEQGHLGHLSRRRGDGPLKRLRAVGLGYATFAVPSGGLLGRRRLSLGREVTVTGPGAGRPLLEAASVKYLVHAGLVSALIRTRST